MKRPVYDLTRPGWAVTAAAGVLLAMGLASIWASAALRLGGKDVPGQLFAVKQAINTLLGVAVAAAVLRVGYLRIARHAYVIYGVCLVLLLPMLLAKFTGVTLGGLVPAQRGAHRWIQLPAYQLQPSEMMKVGFILVLAWYLRFRKNYRTLGGLMWPFGLAMVPMVFILLQPDLGTVLLFFPVLFGMLFVAGARIKHLGLILALGVLAAPLMWSQMHGYQRSRITAVLLQSPQLRAKIAAHPKQYAFMGVDRREALEWKVSTGMQLVRSKAALGSGGVLGRGWGHGTYVEYNFLPDRHNDFVFAIIGHQWGLAGCVLVLACFVVIVVAGVEIATVTTEPCGRLLAMGVVCLLAAQALINVGMTVGLMPVTGMTLPFVSYGGSSLITNIIAIALLISVSQHRPFMIAPKPFEWREQAEVAV